MAEHTPGPWVVIDGGPSKGDPNAHHLTVQPAAAHGLGWVGKRYLSTGGIMSWEDARLIAAAPDLLRIARAVVEGYAELDFDLQSCAREAAAIIAKAEGRDDA